MSFGKIDRRSFLKVGAASVIGFQRLGLAAERDAAPVKSPRALSFYNLHTSERLKTTYWAEGQYIPESLEGINRLFRDHRNGQVYKIDPQLLDTLHELRTKLESTEPFELISGYRSSATNSVLRSQGHGVAENSLHTKGMAADIRIPGRSLILLRKAALSLKAGGVGYYPESQFVHVDVGRVRTW